MLRSLLIRLNIVLIVIFIATGTSYAQRWKLLRYQVGAGAGTMQIFGDIGGTASSSNWFGLKDISFDETRMAYYINAGYKINTRFSTKVNVNYGSGRATDEGSRNDRGRSYSATLLEPSVQIEYYFLTEEARSRSGGMYNRKGMVNNYSTISAYGFFGAGAAFTSLTHTTGEIGLFDSYKNKNVAPVIFLGLGAKYVIDEHWYINAELGYRYAFNDYVEGYTQTASSKNNDVYYMLMFSVNYRIKTTKRNLPAFLDGKYKRYGY